MSIGLFKSSFLNESTNNEKSLNEGVGASQMAKLLSYYKAADYIEEKSDVPELVKDTKEICKILGDSLDNVCGIDENCDEEGAEKIYKKLDSAGYDIIEDNGQFSGDSEISINKKLNVVRSVDFIDSFTMYWFSAKSKF
jgi:hypothetical protein